MIIHKRHVPWWHEITEEENASLIRVPCWMLQIFYAELRKNKDRIIYQFFV
jgi:hypothetical protein